MGYRNDPDPAETLPEGEDKQAEDETAQAAEEEGENEAPPNELTAEEQEGIGPTDEGEFEEWGDEEGEEEELDEYELELQRLRDAYEKIMNEAEEINAEIDNITKEMQNLETETNKKKADAQMKKLTKKLDQQQKKLNKLLKEAMKIHDQAPNEPWPPIRIAATLDEKSMPVDWKKVLDEYTDISSDICVPPDPKKTKGPKMMSRGVKMCNDFCNIPDPYDEDVSALLVTGGRRCTLKGYSRNSKKKCGNGPNIDCDIANIFPQKTKSNSQKPSKVKQKATDILSPGVRMNAEFCDIQEEASNENCGLLITAGRRKELKGRNKRCNGSSSTQ